MYPHSAAGGFVKSEYEFYPQINTDEHRFSEIRFNTKGTKVNPNIIACGA